MAAAQSTLGEQIREELTCSICLELFTRPKVLPCQHTFCQDCLQDFAGKKIPLQCPNCCRQVRLPPQGVTGLPDNHLVRSLCEKLKNQATVSQEAMIQPQSGRRCIFHHSENLNLYCQQCHIPVCKECCEKHHGGHPTTSLEKASEERRSSAQVLVADGRKILETYSSYIQGLREKEKTLNEQKRQTNDSIIQTYNHIVQKLTERKDHLLSTVEENHRNNLDKIQNGRDRVLTGVNELSAACDRAEQEMEQGGSGFLSQETILVVERYRAQAKGTPTPEPIQTHTAVFGPSSIPEPLLGLVTVGQPLPFGPIPAAPALIPALPAPIPAAHVPIPAAPASGDSTAKGIGHHHGNQGQGEGQFRRLRFGGKGVESDEFDYPSGVTVSDEEEIFVANSIDPEIYRRDLNPNLNCRIQVFTLQGTFVRQFQVEGMDCHDVTMDREGNLWVVGMRFVAQYTKQGRVLRRFKIDPQMPVTRGAAVDNRQNHIFTTHVHAGYSTHLGENKQIWRREVRVFSSDGTLVRTVTSQQLDLQPFGQLNLYITIDKEGNILVSDCDGHCIQVYNKDGQFLYKFGSEGSGEGQLKHPCGICTDRAGNMIVADRGNRRVEMFDKTGRFLKHITTDMTEPGAVAIATQGQVVVTDTAKCQINIFSNF
ncbi:uncharacterized protein LOC144862067 [Branchiostoma floridae x Branchiostoma japonicum]